MECGASAGRNNECVQVKRVRQTLFRPARTKVPGYALVENLVEVWSRPRHQFDERIERLATKLHTKSSGARESFRQRVFTHKPGHGDLVGNVPNRLACQTFRLDETNRLFLFYLGI